MEVARQGHEGADIVTMALWRRLTGREAITAIVCVAAVAAAIQASLWWGRDDGVVSTIWLGNAVPVGVLLLVPRRRWGPYLAGFFAISTALVLLDGSPASLAIGSSAINVVEVALLSLLLARDTRWIDGLSNSLPSWTTFGRWVLIIPIAGATAGSLLTMGTLDEIPWTGEAFWDVARAWYASDVLAIGVVVPSVVRLRPSVVRRARGRRHPVEALGWLALLVLATAMVFRQDNAYAQYLLLIPLFGILFKVGLSGFALATAALTAVTLSVTRSGRGPFVTIAGGDEAHALLSAQGFLIAVIGVFLVMAALHDSGRRSALIETVSDDVYRLIFNTSGDMIVVSSLEDGSSLYLSPATAELLGLPQGALLGMGWADHVHPDDIPMIEHALTRMREGVRAFDITIRLRHADGSQRWFEARLRRSTVEATAETPALLVGTLRDITLRKQREEALTDENAELALLSLTDPLTGLANRRWFDQRQIAEADRAARNRTLLSLLVIDIDNFKSYNDHHGHSDGDRCLRAVASAIRGSVRSPDDLCARYGGEEFVVLLPAAGSAVAVEVAERVRSAVGDLRLPHPEMGTLSVSVGIATMKPTLHWDVRALFDAADAALYRAKQAGRDRIEIA